MSCTDRVDYEYLSSFSDPGVSAVSCMGRVDCEYFGALFVTLDSLLLTAWIRLTDYFELFL